MIITDKPWNLEAVVRNIISSHYDIEIHLAKLIQASVERQEIKWKPPTNGYVKLNVDRSCNHNGEIGSRGLLRDGNGQWICRFSSKDGCGDVLFAELFGLFYGVTIALQNRCERVSCDFNGCCQLGVGLKLSCLPRVCLFIEKSYCKDGFLSLF